MNANELRSAALLALSKTLGDASDRDQINDGSAFHVSATISGQIDGYAFELPVDCSMTVGHESTRASSVNPKINEVVGLILSKLNGATREAVKRDVLTHFAETNTVEASDEATKDAGEFLSALRQQVSQTVRGSVKVEDLVRPAVAIRKRRLAIAA